MKLQQSKNLAWFAFAILLFWGLLALLFATESYLSDMYEGTPFPFLRSLGYSLARYSIWALLSPAVLWLAHSVRPSQRTRFICVHLAGGVATALLQAWLFAVIFFPLYRSEHTSRYGLWRSMLAYHFASNLVTYFAITGIAVGFGYYSRLREREARESEIEALLARAELEVLRAQLQPHFLFNTLHAISALVTKDPVAADRMLARLGDLLRMALNDNGRMEVRLAEEIDMLTAYLDIQQIRFGHRLRVDWEIQPSTLNAAIPHFLLQPLVENAIRYAIAASSSPGAVRISSQRQQESLALQVEDDGPGTDLASLREGIGLANTRARLTRTYGSRHAFELSSVPGQGFKVTIRVPFRNELAPEAVA